MNLLNTRTEQNESERYESVDASVRAEFDGVEDIDNQLRRVY